MWQWTRAQGLVFRVNEMNRSYGILALALTTTILVSEARAQSKAGLLVGPNSDRSEEVKKEIGTGIRWKVTPPNVVVFLDGKRLGEAGELKFTETKPGTHKIKLVKGGDETESEVPVKKGQAIKFVYDFSE